MLIELVAPSYCEEVNKNDTIPCSCCEGEEHAIYQWCEQAFFTKRADTILLTFGITDDAGNCDDCMKNYFKKISPDRETLEKNKVLKPVAHLLAHPKIWHFNRRSIAAGIAIGLFFGSLPIAGQMPLAAMVAIACRVNMPIAILFTWFSNPFTMPVIFTGNYYFGAWLLGRPPIHLGDMNWNFESLINVGGDIVVPLFFGSIVVGALLAAISFVTVRLLWRFSIIRSRRADIKQRAARK